MRGGTELGRVRGLGSARAGVGHWLVQRLTAIGNVALTVWLVAALLRLPNFEGITVVGWLASPWTAVPMLLLLVSVLWHLRLGLQIFIEDYVHQPGTKLMVLIALNFYVVIALALGLFAIGRIALTGAPA